INDLRPLRRRTIWTSTVLNDLAREPQTAGTAIVLVRAGFRFIRRKVQPRQNLADKALPAQDASVGEEQKLGGLRVVRHATPRVFLVLGIGNGPAADELRPVLVVVALVDCEVAEAPCPGKRGGVNPELFTDEINDADLGCVSSASCHLCSRILRLASCGYSGHSSRWAVWASSLYSPRRYREHGSVLFRRAVTPTPARGAVSHRVFCSSHTTSSRSMFSTLLFPRTTCTRPLSACSTTAMPWPKTATRSPRLSRRCSLRRAYHAVHRSTSRSSPSASTADSLRHSGTVPSPPRTKMSQRYAARRVSHASTLLMPKGTIESGTTSLFGYANCARHPSSCSTT